MKVGANSYIRNRMLDGSVISSTVAPFSKCLFWIRGFCEKKLIPKIAKIVGGKDTKPGKHPHQVLIRTFSRERVRIGGGSLITNQHILTAAHCLIDVDYVIVYFGSIHSHFATSERIEYVAKNGFLIHPQYAPKFFKNDIAIIRLNNPIPLSHKINTIRLPKLGRSCRYIYEEKSGIVTGWGTTSDGSRTMARILQEAKVKTMKQYIARSYFGFFNYSLSDSQLCTDFKKTQTGTSKGDSGGPLLIMESDGRPTLVGIISVGAIKPQCDFPSVYTNVAIFIPWICQETGLRPRKSKMYRRF